MCWPLILATDNGCYEIRPGQNLVKIRLGVDNEPAAFYAVAADLDPIGNVVVAVAAQRSAGVFISREAARAESFRSIGLQGKNIRSLAVQRNGTARHLWAGVAAIGDQEGSGAHRLNLNNTGTGWMAYGDGWRGGSCASFAFRDNQVFAGTHHAGVVLLNLQQRQPVWRAPVIGCGLPIRDDSQRLAAIRDLAIAGDNDQAVLMCATRDGVYAPIEQINSLHFRHSSQRDQVERVTLPENWLFCSAQHAIEVINDDGS